MVSSQRHGALKKINPINKFLYKNNNNNKNFLETTVFNKILFRGLYIQIII